MSRSIKHTIAIVVVALMALWAQTAVSGQGPAPLPDALQPVTRQLSPLANPAAAIATWRASQGGVNAATVFPPDDRVEVKDGSAPGIRTITLILTFDSLGNPLEQCSGTMIGDNVVLTAAHCVYNSGTYVGSVVVVPGATSTTHQFGYAVASRFAVPNGWANNVGNAAPGSPVPLSPYDWALIFLDDNPFHSQIGPYLTVADATDAYFRTPGLKIATAGYPADKSPDSMWTAATTDFTIDDTYLTSTLDIYFGQSGSPVYTIDPASGAGFIFSVISVGDDTANYSVRFTPTVIDAFTAYCASNGCSFTSAMIQDGYAFNGSDLCRSSPTCASGGEPLLVGQPVEMGFRLDPNPTAPIYGASYLNGNLLNTFSWAEPPAPGGGTFYVSDPKGVGVPSGPGTLEIRVWVGPVYVGAFSAQVLAALPPTQTPAPAATPQATPSPTMTPSLSPSPTPSPSPTATVTPAPTPRPKVFHAVLPGLAMQ